MEMEYKLRALLKDGTGWRYGVYPYIAPEMSNTIYPMFKFWQQFRSLYQRQTLGTYIGRKDKNGKEIFSGDILHFDEKEWGSDKDSNFVIEWNPELCGFEGNGAPSDWTTFCQVIGNIYETPNILADLKIIEHQGITRKMIIDDAKWLRTLEN